jgi:hypothetical protein
LASVSLAGGPSEETAGKKAVPSQKPSRSHSSPVLTDLSYYISPILEIDPTKQWKHISSPETAPQAKPNFPHPLGVHHFAPLTLIVGITYHKPFVIRPDNIHI